MRRFKNTQVHGDVKSPNVLISEAGIAKLTDFGNIRLKKYTLEFSGTITGSKISLRWAAPELLKEESASTKEADVYALGMTFLETVTGKIPFSGKTEFTVLAAILQGKTPKRPQELDTWIGGRKADLLWVAMSQCWNHQAPGRPSAMKVKNSLETLEPVQELA